MPGKRGRPLLFEQLSRKLFDEIRGNPGERLPAMRALARRYGVAVVTVAKAVELLKRQGVLEVYQGSRARVRPANPDAVPEAASPPNRVYDIIRAGIGEGRLKAGQTLPKVKYYCISEKASAATVCEALARLADEGLIHKRQRRWKVGPASPAATSLSPVRADPSDLPAVLLLLPRLEHWNNLCMYSHTRQLLQAMAGEFDRYDVRPTTGIMEQRPVAAIASGRSAVRQHVRRLGGRYQGAVVIADATNTGEPLLREWLQLLLKSGKPVVWMDYKGEWPHFSRKAFHSNLFYRCHGGGPQKENVAMETLAGLGHTHVVYVDYVVHRGEAWNRERIDGLQAAARRHSVHFEMVLQDEAFWSAIRRDDMQDKSAFFRYCLSIYESLRDSTSSAASQHLDVMYREKLAESVPSLAAAVFDSPATALIAANDWVAAAYAIWLGQMGVRVPFDLSLLSFNNDINFTHYPISTIDQGFGDLGYCAAHIFIGDIPIRADRDGNIAVRPFLVDRGSLGRPRRGRLTRWQWRGTMG